MTGRREAAAFSPQARAACILALVTTSLAGASYAHTQQPQGHHLAVRRPGCVPGECICTGQADVRARLNENGPRPSELRRGVRCIVADFDGNGAVDHALPGGEGIATVILSTRGGGFLKAVTVDAAGMIHLYSPRATPGPHGEPPSKLPGLFVPWVGRSHAVFLWNGEGFARTLFRPRNR
jgi:hypothetical protein